MSPTNRAIFVFGTLMMVVCGFWGVYNTVKANRLMADKPDVTLSDEFRQQVESESPAEIRDR